MRVLSRPSRGRTSPPLEPRRRSPVIRLGLLAILVLLGVLLALSATRTIEAARSGLAGKRSLLAAEQQINAQELAPARQHLMDAETSFTEMRRKIKGLGPLRPVARLTPLVRVQLRGIEAFSDAGILVARAGRQLADAASPLIQPTDQEAPISGALKQLEGVREALGSGVAALDIAVERVRALDGYRLIGPLAGARSDLRTNLDRISARATSAREGLDALVVFAGANGPRRYLLFSQNPDELRPTGGFMGTYGVITAGPDGLAIERYEGIEKWIAAHPEAVVAADQVPSPFRFYDPPLAQTLANVNATPDWPTAARLALELWQRGGEEPVDGVLAVTPSFLARVLGVVGPVSVPTFGEVVTAANLSERFDFYTRESEQRTPTGRLKKDFIADLAGAVVEQVLDAPASQWVGLGAVIGRSFELREAMAWSGDEAVTTSLVNRGWDGTLPPSGGDFFYDSEFEYAAKNGRALRRTFDHHVQLDANGSGVVTTSITIENTDGPRPFNESSLTYHTLYGPVGATLDEASEPPAAREPTLNGHPAAGWFRAAGPNGTASLKVVWKAPDLARRLPDGSWAYGLWFMHLPDHTGDVLNLTVELPAGSKWEDDAPPPTTSLDADVVGTWRFSAPRR